MIFEYDEERHIKNEKAISYEEGLAKGREEGKTGLVKVMLKKGSLSFEEISEYSGFSIEEIQKLQAEITG